MTSIRGINLEKAIRSQHSSHSWWSVAGFFGRINYAYKDKYLFEANGRYDGSSRFGKGERWGFFPSASAAWRITEEPWMKSFKPVLSSLKLRGSYGEVGNQDVPLSAYIPTLTVSNPEKEGNYWLINKQYVPYISSSPALVDPTLTWEDGFNLDFAIDVVC